MRLTGSLPRDATSRGAVLGAAAAYMAVADPAIPLVAFAFCLSWRTGLALIKES